MGMLFLCCLRIANVQYKCIHARRTCVTTPWVAGQNPRRADFYFLLLSSSPCIVGVLFLCCLRIANVQYKCIHVRRTCVTTPWVAGQNPRRADFYFLLLPSSPCIVGMLFLCCLRIANVQYKCIHARRTCVTTPWVAGQNPRRADFYFCFCQAPRATKCLNTKKSCWCRGHGDLLDIVACLLGRQGDAENINNHSGIYSRRLSLDPHRGSNLHH